VTLAVHGLTKAYGTKRVLDGVDLTVASGEIHALLGPNGSGKSTLIGCLSGAVVPDAGTVHIADQPLTDITPRRAIEAGIAVIYQHFSLVDSLTVAENIFLGSEQHARGRVDQKSQAVEAAMLLEPFGRPIRPESRLSDLRVGDRQLVEIAKALHRHPRVLILDEPTAALGEQEASQLGRFLKGLRAEGLAILYVTHILSEVFAIADRATVIRDGAVTLASPVAKLDAARVIAAISPSTSSEAARAPAIGRGDDAATALQVTGLVVDGIGPLDLSVNRGEILAIFGLLGSGRTEILEALYGARRIQAGRLTVGDRPYRPRSPSQALGSGIALVAGDRLRQSILTKMSALDNVLLPHFRSVATFGFRPKRRERQVFDSVAARLSLKPPDPTPLAWAFSGGNQQKLAVGRWLAAGDGVDVFLLDEPTQGIDVGARADLYVLLRALARDEGKAIVFTSSDPEETIALADRIMILLRGRIIAVLTTAECDEHRILAIAHGTADDGLGVPAATEGRGHTDDR